VSDHLLTDDYRPSLPTNGALVLGKLVFVAMFEKNYRSLDPRGRRLLSSGPRSDAVLDRLIEHEKEI
jgi:hypothetical protein